MGEPASGLTVAELALAALALEQELAGARVLDADIVCSHPQHRDDLVLVLQPRDTEARRRLLHIALGADRARVTVTSHRFRRDERVTGPRTDLVRAALQGSSLDRIQIADGERRITLLFSGRELVVELFSAKGLWALCRSDGIVEQLSRPVSTKVRTLRVGDRYVPPPPRDGTPAADTVRFDDSDLLDSIDAWYTSRDLASARGHQAQQLIRRLQGELRRLQHRIDGLTEQLTAAEQAVELRSEADLLLSYQHQIPRGAAEASLPDPTDPEGGLRKVALDPALPVSIQAKKRYERARRLTDGKPITEQRRQDARTRHAAIEVLLRKVEPHAAAQPTPPDGLADDGRAANLTELLQQARNLGLVMEPVRRQENRTSRAGPLTRRKQEQHLAESLRRFRSVEGYEILVGRNNQQNDRLSMRIARGNDVWLHVGGGRPGSHVVVRLPKNKTASLETLLDAASLAVHFSKARGERLIEVLYTQAKNVRKPKGSAPGSVVPMQTKTLASRLDPERLRRLLDQLPGGD
jgi:predicted ribosome quality control (RQC) complex YloA/Tae2 family protein